MGHPEFSLHEVWKLFGWDPSTPEHMQEAELQSKYSKGCKMVQDCSRLNTHCRIQLRLENILECGSPAGQEHSGAIYTSLLAWPSAVLHLALCVHCKVEVAGICPSSPR